MTHINGLNLSVTDRFSEIKISRHKPLIRDRANTHETEKLKAKEEKEKY